MGDDKWARRTPGSASGTVVPPPAGDDLPPLPQRRGLVRSRLSRGSGEKDQRSSATTASRPAAGNSAGSRRAADFSTHSTTEFPQNSGNGTPSPNLPGPRRQQLQENSQAQRNLRNTALPPGPDLPDNVRQLFPPVLRSRRVLPATARALHPSVSKAQRTQAQPVTEPPPGTRDQPPSGDQGTARGLPSAGSRLPKRVPGVSARMLEADPSTARTERGSPGAHAAGRSASLAAAWGAETPLSPATRRNWLRSRPRGTRQPLLTGPGGRRHVAWMVSLSLVVLVTATGTLVALIRQPAGDSQRARQGPGAWSGAAAARASAAQWVSSQVSRSEMIG